MKTIILILTILLCPVMTKAETTITILCDDISSIEVWRIRGELWHAHHEPVDGYSYIVMFKLKPDAGARVEGHARATPTTTKQVGKYKHHYKDLRLKVNDTEITSEAPRWDNFSREVIIITKKTRRKAFSAARKACPKKAPAKMLTDGS